MLACRLACWLLAGLLVGWARSWLHWGQAGPSLAWKAAFWLHVATILTPFWSHFGALEVTLGSQGGLEGPNMGIDAILAPISLPFWIILELRGRYFEVRKMTSF